MARLTKEEVEERIKLLRTPIDFERLISDGVLQREGAWYRILDPARLPEHVIAQIGGITETEAGLCFRFGPLTP